MSSSQPRIEAKHLNLISMLFMLGATFKFCILLKILSQRSGNCSHQIKLLEKKLVFLIFGRFRGSNFSLRQWLQRWHASYYLQVKCHQTALPQQVMKIIFKF